MQFSFHQKHFAQIKVSIVSLLLRDGVLCCESFSVALSDHSRAAITGIQRKVWLIWVQQRTLNDLQELSVHVHLPAQPASRRGARRTPTSPPIYRTADRRLSEEEEEMNMCIIFLSSHSFNSHGLLGSSIQSPFICQEHNAHFITAQGTRSAIFYHLLYVIIAFPPHHQSIYTHIFSTYTLMSVYNHRGS